MLTLYLLSLPRIGLPDSLESLSNFANQVQSVASGAIAHPIWAIAAVVFGIGLLQLIADLVKRIIKSTLTFVITLPLTLSQWIWKKTTAGVTPSLMRKTTKTEHRAEQLIERLEALRSEQDQIIAELKGLFRGAGESEQSDHIEIAETPLTQIDKSKGAESEDVLAQSI